MENEKDSIQSTEVGMRTRVVLLWASVAMLPAVGQAQFICRTNSDNTITIAKYKGSGGDVTIPTTINGLAVAPSTPSFGAEK